MGLHHREPAVRRAVTPDLATILGFIGLGLAVVALAGLALFLMFTLEDDGE